MLARNRFLPAPSSGGRLSVADALFPRMDSTSGRRRQQRLRASGRSLKKRKPRSLSCHLYLPWGAANPLPLLDFGIGGRTPLEAFWESFTIITTTPNELTASVHNRMPVILRPQDYDLWLSHVAVEKNTPPVPQLELLALLRPYPSDRMEAREAHVDVGNVRNNHPGLINSA